MLERTRFDALESICRVVRRLSEQEHNRRQMLPFRKRVFMGPIRIPYFESVKIAYSESAALRDYLDCSVDEIDKDLNTLWPLTYKIIYDTEMIKAEKRWKQVSERKMTSEDKDSWLTWFIDRYGIAGLTPGEEAEQQRQLNKQQLNNQNNATDGQKQGLV